MVAHGGTTSLTRLAGFSELRKATGARKLEQETAMVSYMITYCHYTDKTQPMDTLTPETTSMQIYELRVANVHGPVDRLRP